MPKNKDGQEVNDQHINTSGRARLLSVGKVVPTEWGWVRVTRTRYDDKTVWLRIEELQMVTPA